MDKNVLRERKRLKQQQLRRRKMMRRCIVAGGILLAAVFLIRGILMPLIGGISGGHQDGDGEVVTSQDVASVDPNAAVRQPVKGLKDLGKLLYITPGWHSDDQGRWYQNPDRTYYRSGFQSIDGVQYYFTDDGYTATGWVTVDSVDYFFNDDGSYNPDKKKPLLCLTFDDGPGQYTNRLLDCLEEYDAHATFFMLGELVDYYPDEIKRMLELGCELGNHSYDHSQLTTLSLDQVESQFDRTDEKLIGACGQAATVARAPYGAYNDEIIATVGKPFFMWSLDSLDWSYKDVDLDYNEIMGGDLTDGTIILMHDIHEPSVECAIRIIPELIDMGYRLVTVSEMAKAKNVELQNASYSDFWKTSLDGGWVAGYKGEFFSDSGLTGADSSYDADDGNGNEDNTDDGSYDSEEEY